MSRSIYQTNGKPLSQHALYQQKLKQGVYASPGIPSVGVNSNASDTAALLAASTDLTVRPSYERTVAPEAQEAALAAKLDKIYEWSRTVDGNAASAASAGLNDYSKRSNTISSTTTYQSSSSQLGLAGPLKGGSIYKAANANSSSTMTSRINPDKDFRHGLLPKGSATALNIDKISSVANANSAKTMDSRINPSLNVSRSGLARDDRSKSFKAGDISGQYLLSAASEKAQARLNSMSASGTPADFKAQAQAYANALTIAQQRSDERVAQNKKGLIDLGGGLTVTQAELDAMASLIVQPVLKDINSKAQLQRDTDKAAQQKKMEAIKAHDRAKRDEYAAKQKEKADLEAAKQERIEANNKEKDSKDAEFEAYSVEEKKKIEAKLEELKAQEEKHAAAKEVLLTQKQENQDKIDNEEQELIGSRKTVLDDMQAERDEEIAPILEELKEETGKLNELTDAKNELDDEVTKLSSLNEEYTAKIKELEEQLKAAEEDIESHTKNLEESSAKLEETNKEIQELTQSTETELGQIDDEHKKLDEEIGTLSQTKQQHLDDKTKQKAEIKQQLAARVEEEHAINSELPEHLRKDVNEKKLADTSSLFSDEAAPEPEVKAEPVTKTDKPSATAATVKTKKVKASRIKRLSNFFKSKPPTPTKVPVKVSDIKKANSKADIKKEPVDVKSQKTTDSYDGFEEEIPPNKGGLFKEEI